MLWLTFSYTKFTLMVLTIKIVIFFFAKQNDYITSYAT